MDCNCNCHKTDKPCGICCSEVAKQFLTPPGTIDKSKDILEKLMKGKT